MARTTSPVLLTSIHSPQSHMHIRRGALLPILLTVSRPRQSYVSTWMLYESIARQYESDCSSNIDLYSSVWCWCTNSSSTADKVAAEHWPIVSAKVPCKTRLRRAYLSTAGRTICAKSTASEVRESSGCHSGLLQQRVAHIRSTAGSARLFRDCRAQASSASMAPQDQLLSITSIVQCP